MKKAITWLINTLTDRVYLERHHRAAVEYYAMCHQLIFERAAIAGVEYEEI